MGFTKFNNLLIKIHTPRPTCRNSYVTFGFQKSLIPKLNLLLCCVDRNSVSYAWVCFTNILFYFILFYSDADCSTATFAVMTKRCDIVMDTEPVTYEGSDSSKLLVPLKQVNVCLLCNNHTPCQIKPSVWFYYENHSQTDFVAKYKYDVHSQTIFWDMKGGGVAFLLHGILGLID